MRNGYINHSALAKVRDRGDHSPQAGKLPQLSPGSSFTPWSLAEPLVH